MLLKDGLFGSISIEAVLTHLRMFDDINLQYMCISNKDIEGFKDRIDGQEEVLKYSIYS